MPHGKHQGFKEESKDSQLKKRRAERLNYANIVSDTKEGIDIFIRPE